MKTFPALLLLPSIVLISCSGNDPAETPAPAENAADSVTALAPEYREEAALQEILDSADVAGSILIFDSTANIYHVANPERARTGFLPASTFKIPNSIIALETGVVVDRNTMFEWDGVKRQLDAWNQDLTLKEAYAVSCVPCYQKIAREVGSDRMNEYLKKFDYGEMDVREDNIDLFWLEGDSKISQQQQIDFLKKLYNRQLPISEKTYEEMRAIMLLEENDVYSIRAKTGWAIRNGNNIGWFVGYLESGGNVYFFAVNVEPTKQFDMDDFPMVRKKIAMEAFRRLGIIPESLQ